MHFSHTLDAVDLSGASVAGGHGLGMRDVAVPTRVRGGLEHERVVLVRLGNSFAAVLTASGRVCPDVWEQQYRTVGNRCYAKSGDASTASGRAH